MIASHLTALFLAIALTPWILGRRMAPHNTRVGSLALWGALMAGLNISIPITLHLLGIRITADSLALAHLLTGLLVLAWTMSSPVSRESSPLDGPATPGMLALAALIFACLVLPFTHIAGIDTYKWQDLAGNVAVEGRIGWLIHPISLLGFTPRSYPSAQPLVLATIEILGHTGVDWGFYLLSLCFGITGLTGAWMLGQRLALRGNQATWFSILYCFAPVFMRYNYWATGRGLLLALLPLYLLTLLNLRRPPASPSPPRSKLLNVVAFVCLSLLLALSHKAGLVGILLIPMIILLSPGLAVLRGRGKLLVGFLASLAAGLLFVNGGDPATLLYRLATRFGWLIPLMAAGLYGSSAQFGTPASRAMLAGAFALLPLSCTPDMYGALLALPFVAFTAVTGFAPWIDKATPQRRALGLSLILVPAVAIVINQAQDSPGDSVYRAARFLEQHDPSGPFRIDAPGKARTQMQAYVSGCPRFTIDSGESGTIAVHRPPSWTGHPGQDARHWIDYLRGLLDLRDVATDWYGSGRVYTVTIAGEGPVPPQARLLFSHGDVKVFEGP